MLKLIKYPVIVIMYLLLIIPVSRFIGTQFDKECGFDDNIRTNWVK